MKQQKGFTLIELIMVIVILGILAATALPKFVDIKDDAEAAAIKGVAGAVSSSFVVNYAGYAAAGTAKGTRVSGTYNAANLITLVNGIMAGSIPAGYTATVSPAGDVVCDTSAGLGIQITVSNGNHAAAANKTAAATLLCTG